MATNVGGMMASKLLGRMQGQQTGSAFDPNDPTRPPDIYDFAATQTRLQSLNRLRRRRGLASTILNPATGGIRDRREAAPELSSG